MASGVTFAVATVFGRLFWPHQGKDDDAHTRHEESADKSREFVRAEYGMQARTRRMGTIAKHIGQARCSRDDQSSQDQARANLLRQGVLHVGIECRSEERR